jgi:uncharacterized phage protein (TIGR01671 family)
MNREIKFRGRRIDDGKWFYGNYVVENHLGVLKHGIMFYDRLEGIDVTVEVDERTVGQFIELRDKNGNEIYEGDVVKWKSTHTGASNNIHTDQIKWIDDMACYMLMPWVHEPHAAEMEVISNIYENPELLNN